MTYKAHFDTLDDALGDLLSSDNGRNTVERDPDGGYTTFTDGGLYGSMIPWCPVLDIPLMSEAGVDPDDYTRVFDPCEFLDVRHLWYHFYGLLDEFGRGECDTFGLDWHMVFDLNDMADLDDEPEPFGHMYTAYTY